MGHHITKSKDGELGSQDSDQPRQGSCLISVYCTLEESPGPVLPSGSTKDIDQMHWVDALALFFRLQVC